jgi:hypothetical protein
MVGAINIHHIGFGKKIVMPTSITYLRPGITRSSSSGDTRLTLSSISKWVSYLRRRLFLGRLVNHLSWLEAHPIQGGGSVTHCFDI